MFESGLEAPTSMTAPAVPVSSALQVNLPVETSQPKFRDSASQSVSNPPVVLGSQKAEAET